MSLPMPDVVSLFSSYSPFEEDDLTRCHPPKYGSLIEYRDSTSARQELSGCSDGEGDGSLSGPLACFLLGQSLG